MHTFLDPKKLKIESKYCKEMLSKIDEGLKKEVFDSRDSRKYSFHRTYIPYRLTRHSKEEWKHYFQVVDEYCLPGKKYELTPRLLKEIHHKILPEMQWSGKWKAKRHYKTTEYSRQGVSCNIEFRTVAARKVSFYLSELFKRYNQALKENEIHPLILIAALVMDFYMIHPFLDGNGRISRVLCRMLLNQQGYTFISCTNLDRYLRSKDALCSFLVSYGGWHKHQHSPLMWYKGFLRAIYNAKKEFEKRIEMQEIAFK